MDPTDPDPLHWFIKAALSAAVHYDHDVIIIVCCTIVSVKQCGM
jgi:hypothetical protein